MQSIQNAPHAIKCLATSQERAYVNSLKHLKMEACILKEENHDGWVVNQPPPQHIFTNLNRYIESFENLETLELVGMAIVDNLEDMINAVRRPKLKKLSLPLNGIEQEYCTFF